MSALTYAVDVFAAGTTSYSTGSIDFTLDLADLSRPPIIAAPVVRPLEGRSEARSWTVDVVDGGGGFTAQLADAGGRLDLLNRWTRVRRGVNGATPTVIGGGRLRDVVMGEDVASYRLTVEPELAVPYDRLVFNTTNTTRIYPPGPDVAYGPFSPPPKGTVDVKSYYSLLSFKAFLLRFEPGWAPLTDLGFQAIREDMESLYFVPDTRGAFKKVRCRVGATDYPIASFGAISNTAFSNPGGAAPDPNPLGDLEAAIYRAYGTVDCWVITSSSTQFSVGGTYSSAFLHMFSAPPSPATPLHIGTSAGEHPMTLKRRLLAGAYSTAGQTPIRYSTAAFATGSTGVESLNLPRVRFRVTGPERLGDFIADKLNAPNGIVDFLDSSGRIRPRSVWLPASTAGFGFTFSGTNLRDPHPSWLHPGREMVTAVRIEHTAERWALGTIIPALLAEVAQPPNLGADFLAVTTRTTEVRHDRVTQLGLRPIRIQAHGVHTGIPGFLGPYTPSLDPNLQACTANLKREIFERFGDGPLMGTLAGLSSASTVAEGDYARLTLGTFPNPGLNARGGTRLVQVMGKGWDAHGPVFDYLDVGPNLNPLSAPSLTLALSTVNKKHAVVATVGNVPSGGNFELHAAISATTAAPAVGSTLWTQILTGGGASGAYIIGSRPSGSKTWGRVRATKMLRVRSTWKYSTAGVTSSGLTAPTITGMTGVAARTATLGLTPGENLYPLQVFVDTSTSASYTAGNLYASPPAGTKSVPLFGLTGNTKHKIGVRHVDAFGGVSAADSTTFTTLSTGSSGNFLACPAPAGLYLGTAL